MSAKIDSAEVAPRCGDDVPSKQPRQQQRAKLPAPERPVHSVKAETVPEPSFMQSFAELLHDVMPQSSAAASKQPEHERIDWVAFQQCDLNDDRFGTELEQTLGGRSPLVMLVGLAKGYQVWALTTLGEAQLLYSDRQGPVNIVQLLPEPEPCFANVPSNQVGAVAAECRPLMAVVEATAASGTKPGCALACVSMQTGKHVFKQRYETPVLKIHANSRALVVMFCGSVVVCDTLTFSEQLHITTAYKYDEPSLPSATALRCTQFAYVDNKLSAMYQSCGGVNTLDSSSSYTSQVITVAKNLGKSVSALSESVVTSWSSSPSSGSSQHSPPASHHSAQPCAVTIVDLSLIKPQPQSPVVDPTGSSDFPGLLAHFCAHCDEPVTNMSFSESGSVLCTSGQSGQQLHVFSVQPHPAHSTQSAVLHMYTLQRGQTPARIQDVVFSHDTRWLAASTNHGTTHIFPITPYGGAISVRTHGTARVPNKESRFHKSAGLEAIEQQTQPHSIQPASASPGATHKGLSLSKDTHPSVSLSHQALAKACSNARLPPYPTPLLLSAASKIHQQMFSPSTLTARATDIVPTGQTTKKAVSATAQDGPYMIRALFAPATTSDSGTGSVYLLNSQGQLIEYNMAVAPHDQMAANKYSAAANIALQLCPTALWSLHRTTGVPEVGVPLRACHTLVVASKCIGNALHSPGLLTPVSSSPALHLMHNNNNNTANVLKDNHNLNNDSDIGSPYDSPQLPTKNKKKGSKMSATRITNNNNNSSSKNENNNKPSAKQQQEKRGRSDSNKQTPEEEANNYWVSQVEIVPYNGPHRRLWMGPQFTFKTYRDSPHVLADLMSPSDTRYSRKESGLRRSALVNDSRRSEPMSMPGRSVPVLIEAASDSFDKSYPGVTVEVCGSWSDNDYISCDDQEGRVRECIADAMASAVHAPRGAANKQRVPSTPSDASPRLTVEDQMEDAQSELSDSTEADSLQFVP